MKKVLLLLVLATALAAPSGAQNILLLNEGCGGSLEFFPTALTNAGLAFTEVNTAADFSTQMAGGPWDIVIVDEYANTLDPATGKPAGRLSDDSVAAIEAFIAGGGVVYMNYWDWASHPGSLPAAFEATLFSSYDIPEPIFVWEPGHPLFNVPNAVGDMTPTLDTCATDGYRLEPTGAALALAGYVGAPAPNEAAIVLGNDGRTILFGGILGLFGTEGPDFAANVVEHLLNPVVPVTLQTLDVN